MTIYNFNSSLDRHECKRRLRDTPGGVAFLGGSGIVGLFVSNVFFLWCQRTWLGSQTKNAFAPVCIGYLRSFQGRTTIHCYIGFHPLTILFLILWFGGLIGGCVFLLFSNGFNLLMLLVLWMPFAAMFGIGIGIVMIGLMATGDDSADLLEFLRNTLNIID